MKIFEPISLLDFNNKLHKSFIDNFFLFLHAFPYSKSYNEIDESLKTILQVMKSIENDLKLEQKKLENKIEQYNDNLKRSIII